MSREEAEMQAVLLANQILSGQIGIVEGCRQLVRISRYLDRELLAPFVAVDSETEDLPLGDLRSRWDSDALAKKDKEIDNYLDKVREPIRDACVALIERYAPEEEGCDASLD